MNIRKMTPLDSKQIVALLSELDYHHTEGFIEEKIRELADHPDEYCMVAENEENEVIAFISIHIIPQIALKGDFARISYFSVDERYRSKGVGKLLEEYCVSVAKERNCDRIELHSHTRRERAHHFYNRQGYVESPKYLVKKL